NRERRRERRSAVDRAREADPVAAHPFVVDVAELRVDRLLDLGVLTRARRADVRYRTDCVRGRGRGAQRGEREGRRDHETEPAAGHWAIVRRGRACVKTQKKEGRIAPAFLVMRLPPGYGVFAKYASSPWPVQPPNVASFRKSVQYDATPEPFKKMAMLL